MTAPVTVAERVGGRPATVVLVGGHESTRGADLACWDGVGDITVPAGAPLTEAVAQALVDGELPVCVVPMTLGRDRTLVAESARALAWLEGRGGRGRTVLSEPFATQEHLVGWLRAAAASAAEVPGTAVLVTAPAADPFADAELFRVARLVRQYGHHRWVEVAFTGGDPDVPQGVDRCHRLGAQRVLRVSAGLGSAPALPDALDLVDRGPLLSTAAVEAVLATRCAEALHRLAHGDDGIAAGLDAEHGHGFAHSHGPGEHGHGHAHGPGHEHPHAPDHHLSH